MRHTLRRADLRVRSPRTAGAQPRDVLRLALRLRPRAARVSARSPARTVSRGLLPASMSRSAAGWLVLGWLGFAVLPWYGLPSGSALWEGLAHGRAWLLPLGLPLAFLLVVWRRPRADSAVASTLVTAGVLGLGWMAAQGFAGPRQEAMGWGAGAVGLAF